MNGLDAYSEESIYIEGIESDRGLQLPGTTLAGGGLTPIPRSRELSPLSEGSGPEGSDLPEIPIAIDTGTSESAPSQDSSLDPITGTEIELSAGSGSSSADPLTGAASPPEIPQPTSGYIETGSSGEIKINFLFDGGQLDTIKFGLYSLEGMETYQLGSTDYQLEAARRINSNSLLGMEIINDRHQASRFSPERRSHNFGDYQGEVSFQLVPNAKYGVMLLYSGTWQEFIDNIRPWRGWLFLEYDESQQRRSKQIVDATGDGTLIGLEDIVLDSSASDRDYNDILFQITGAEFFGYTGDELINPEADWRSEPLGQQIIDYALGQIADDEAPIIEGTLANDSGDRNTDGITNVLGIRGTARDDGELVSLRAGFNDTPELDYIDLVSILDSEGNFELDEFLLEAIFGEPLPDGQHTLRLIAEDAASNISTQEVDFVLDTEATSVLTSVDLLAASDSGQSDSDNITNDNTPTLAGTIEQPESESLVLVYSGEELVAQTEASSSWEVTADQLPDGQHSLEVKVIDKAGNLSDALTLDIIVDTLGPQIDLSNPADGGTVTPKSPLAGSVDGTGSEVAALSYGFDDNATMPLPFVGPTGQFNESFQLDELSAGFHNLSFHSEDLAGNTTSKQIGVTVDPTVPFEIADYKPLDGGIDVGVTYKPQVFFSKAVNPATLNSDNFFASFGGQKLAAKIVPADTGEFAWLFFQEALPDASEIRVTVDGSSIMSLEGNEALDADGDGTAGGAFSFDFSTVSLAALPNTALSGIIADPGPDLKPYTSDDVDPGADGEFHTADDTFLLPIEGVKVFAIGLEDEAIFTGPDGRFRFDAMPSGNVKLVVDGQEATNAPIGSYFPEMVMDVNISPGVENYAMPGMQEMFLPRLKEAILEPVNINSTTRIVADATSAPELSPEERQFLSIDVQPNSLLSASGEKLSSGTVGISTVPPELVRDMLPPGVLQHTFDITIQAPGISNFSTPAPMTFPNVFDAAPGTQLNFLSFDHTTGRLVIEGTATVSEDGQSASTDPGTGITHPGWHGLTPPGGLLLFKGPPPGPPPPPCSSDSHQPAHSTTVLPPEVLPLISGESGGFELVWRAPTAPSVTIPSQSSEGCLDPGEQTRPRLEVSIEIDGPLKDFMQRTRSLDLVNQSFTLYGGSGEARAFAGEAKLYDAIDNLSRFELLDTDHLFGAKIKVIERDVRVDGSAHTTEKDYYLYRWLDVIDADEAIKRQGTTAAFFRTFADGPGNFVRTKDVTLHLPNSVNTKFKGSKPEFEYPGDFQGEETATWQFDPVSSGLKKDDIEIEVSDGSKNIVVGNLTAKGTATEPTTIALNLEGYKKELESVLSDIKKVSDTIFEYHYFRPGTEPLRVTDKLGIPLELLIPGPNRSDEATLQSFLNDRANELLEEVKKDFEPVNPVNYQGYNVVAGAEGDVQITWKNTFFFKGGLGSPTHGNADFDVDRDYLKRLLATEKIGKATKQWALAEGLNKKAKNAANISVAANLDWSRVGVQFAEYTANTVSHEVAHTFGLQDAYVLDKKSGTGTAQCNFERDCAPYDIMKNGKPQDPNLEFLGENPALLRAALGLHSNGNTTLLNAVEQYRNGFKLPNDVNGIRLKSSGDDIAPAVALIHDERYLFGDEYDLLGTVAADGQNGASLTVNYTVTNLGSAPLTIDSVGLNDGTTGFSIVDSSLVGQSIAPQETAVLTVRFDPEKVGSFEDTLSITSNAATEPLVIHLEGEAIPNAPTARVTKIDNNLGGVPVAEGSAEEDRIATIGNEGSQALVISGIELAEGIGRFDLLGLPADLAANPIVLNTGEEFSFGVRFDPDYVGLDRALIDIATNDPDQPTIRLSAVGTGLDEVVYPNWGNDFIAVHNSELPGAEILRTVSDDGGNFEFFVAPEEYYEFWAFDPDTGLIGKDTGFTPVSGREYDPASSMVMLASREPDSDFDGLPDDIETAIGSSITNPDTDGDGIDDFSAIQQKIDPLGDSVLPIGVVSAIQPGDNGFVSDVVASGNTAYIASGPAGVQVVNLERITKPIVTASIPSSDLGGDALAVAFTSIPGESPNTEVNLVAAAVGNGGLAIIDVTDPGAANVLHQVSLDGSARKVEIVDTFAYVGKSNAQIDVVDLKTGTLVSSFAPEGRGTVSEVRASGGILYTLRGGTLAAYDLVAQFAAPPLLSSVGVSRPQSLFVGSDRAYLAVDGSLTVLDISDPANMRVTSTDSPLLRYQGVAANGSGRLLVGASTDIRENANLSLFNIEDPDEIGSFLTQFDTPGDVRDIWIQNGLALVADGSGGLAVLNYMQPDPGETPPTLTVSTSSADGSTVVEGDSLVEGQRLRVDVNTLDDVQTSQVRLVANGVDLQADGSFPFNFFVEVPPLSSGTSTLALEVIATDTGGNESTEQLEFSIVEDTTGPQLKEVVPVYRDSPSQAIDSFQVIFNEPLAADTINSSSVRVVKIENGSEVEQAIEFSFEPVLNLLTVRPTQPLAGMANYELQLNRELLTDLAGNAWGTGLFKSLVTVKGIYQTGLSPESIEVGDLNNDDRLDIVTVNRYSDSISILLGNGDGSLQAARELSVGNNPTSVALADLDSDGDEDLLVALAGYSDRVTEFLQDDAGNFLPGNSYPVGNDPSKVALGDVDKDGNPDLVTANSTDGTVSVWSGNPGGSFGTRTDIDLELDKLTSLSLADLDADSDEEVIISGYGYWDDETPFDRIAVVGLNDAALTDVPDTDDIPYVGIEELALGYLNDDPYLDLVSANSDTHNSSVRLNNGDASFAPPTDYPTGLSPVSVALGYLDDDDILDVATANAESGSISVLLGTGSGGLDEPENLPVGSEPSDIALGDFDGDGKQDVAVSDVEDDRLYLVGNWFTAGG